MFAALASPILAGGHPRCEWSRGFHLPGLNGGVEAALAFDDGSGSALYVGGRFNSADDQFSPGLAKWDGEKWSSFYPPHFQSGVAALAAYDGGNGKELVAADFSTYSGSAVARFDGSSWIPMGQIFGQLRALAVVEVGGKDVLYAGGLFQLDHSGPGHQVARWNGSSWIPILSSPGAAAYELTALDTGSGPRLYAGGCLDDGGSGLSGVAMWNGLVWSNLGSGLLADGSPGCAYALAVFDDGSGPALAVGGGFSSAGGVAANGVARWNGSAWTALDANLEFSSILELAVADDGSGRKLYAGGTGFNRTMAVWQGGSWQSLPGGGPNDWVEVIAELDYGSGPELYAMGPFNETAGQATHQIARRRSGSWSPVTSKPEGRGLVGTLRALEVADLGAGETLVAGGSFRLADEVSPFSWFWRNLAEWRAEGWSVLPDPAEDTWVQDLAVFDDGRAPALHAAYSGGGSSSRVARFEDQAWTVLGDPIGEVFELAVLDAGGGAELYAAGKSPYLTRFDGADWETLGSGLADEVWSTAVFDDGSGPALYVSGLFEAAGGAPASHIAKWNGAFWSAVGAGLTFGATDLEVFDDGNGPALYAAGTFEGGLARWDGETWTPLDNQPFDQPQQMVVFDDGTGKALYQAGNDVMGRGLFARREGAAWSLIDGRLSGWVDDAVVFDDGTGAAIYLAGGLNGEHGAQHIARYCSPLLFADGFESGTASRWIAVPALE